MSWVIGVALVAILVVVGSLFGMAMPRFKKVQILIDKLNGRRMGMEATGSSRRQNYKYAPTSRMTNTYIAAGNDDETEIINQYQMDYMQRIGVVYLLFNSLITKVLESIEKRFGYYSRRDGLC